MKILLVEDDNPTRDLVHAMLEKAGYEIKTAGNGKEAVELLEEDAFELVISDIVMPEMDGIELLRQLRANPGTQEIPVLLCSSASEKEFAKRALALGVAGFIRKPIEEQSLLQNVNEIVELFGLREEMEEPSDADEFGEEPLDADPEQAEPDNAGDSQSDESSDDIPDSSSFEAHNDDIPEFDDPETQAEDPSSGPLVVGGIEIHTDESEPTGSASEPGEETPPVTVVADQEDKIAADTAEDSDGGWDDLAEAAGTPNQAGEPAMDEEALDALFSSDTKPAPGDSNQAEDSGSEAVDIEGVDALFSEMTGIDVKQEGEVEETAEEETQPEVTVSEAEHETSEVEPGSEQVNVVSEESWVDSSSLPEALDTARIKLREMGGKIESGDFSDFETYLGEVKKLAQRLDVTVVDESVEQTLARFRELEKEELAGELLSIRSGIEALQGTLDDPL